MVHLQRVLSVQLGALDQLLLHARMCEDWGFAKLADQGQSAVEQARVHVDQLMRRMLFLGGTPDLTQRDPVKVGDSTRELLRLDLESQHQLAETPRSAIAC
jgi:bacterioferritin